jgi:hypothetical protein
VVRISNERAWKALEYIKPGAVAQLYGITVRKATPWTWEVDGQPAQLLLPSIDTLMAAAGFRPLDKPVAVHGPRRPAVEVAP